MVDQRISDLVYEPERNQELSRFEPLFQRYIEENITIIQQNQRPETGLFSASNTKAEGRCDEEHHYEEAWTRDTSLIINGLIDVHKVAPPDVKARIETMVRRGVRGMIQLYGRPESVAAFQQPIEEVTDERGMTYTRPTKETPPVHMKTDGTDCKKGHWEHNQPDSFGEFLVAAARAKNTGIIDSFNEDEIQTLETQAQYLVNIKPWMFESASMWEHQPVRTPPSRSTTLAIVKGLEHIKPLLSHNAVLQENIQATVYRSMQFIKEDPFTDYTIADHGTKTDLAMQVAINLPSTEQSYLDLEKLMEHADAELGAESLPGRIRYGRDGYWWSETGEALWFMAEPLEAMAHFTLTEQARATGNHDKFTTERQRGFEKLSTAILIGHRYGYYPELFVQKDPQHLTDAERKEAYICHDTKRNKEIACIPDPNDLHWNRILVAQACARGVEMLRME